jgi:hypothetical protein
MFKSLLQRCKWALSAFNAQAASPCITLHNGIILDLTSNRLVIPSDFHLHTSGNLKFSSDQNIIISSGNGEDITRSKYVYGVWINSEEDHLGRPLLSNIKKKLIGVNEYVGINNERNSISESDL